MSNRTPRWVPAIVWSIVVLYVAVEIASFVPDIHNAPAALADAIVSTIVLAIIFAVGALLASRRPRNPIGWLYCGGTLISEVGSLGLRYADQALLSAPGSLPAGIWAAVFGAWLRGLGWFLIVAFVPLLFPSGRLASRRWRPLARLIVLALVLLTAVDVFGAFPSDITLATFRSPFAVLNPQVTNAGQGLTTLFLFTLVGVCTVGVILRFRRAQGVERQQLKWFVYGLIWTVLIIAGILVVMFWPNADTTSLLPGSVFFLAVVVFPLATTIAILRYRLYDIDILINRTLVYGVLTATLVVIYFAGVYGTQALLTPLVPAQAVRQSPILIVASTLLIAALFTPLRRRIQATVDRRFYRRKYDAAKTLARFGSALRSEVDLRELSSHLVAVVEETMQPAHVSLWLRSPSRTASDRSADAWHREPLQERGRR